VALKSDLELGGTDQRFNILMGRNIQKDYGIEKPQAALFMPLLEGIDGSEKMSKSLGNYVGINEPADIMYKKIMQIPDGLIIKYYNLATDVHPSEVRKIEASLKNPETNPRDVKMGLAFEITSLYHGAQAAKKAQELFVSVYQKNQVPDEIPELNSDEYKSDDGLLDWVKAIAAAGLAPSNSEARRLIKQGGVKVNGEKCSEFAISCEPGMVITVGKGKFVRIK
jgi:tyrosyl-tRNA synthetase